MGHVDTRTRAREEELRATLGLPVGRVYGSLVGSVADAVLGVALEPGGRHAAVVTAGAVERWDLDAVEPVGRWEAPFSGVRALLSVGETPGGLCVVDERGALWRGTAPCVRPRGEGGALPARGLWAPAAGGYVHAWEGTRLHVARVDDGATVLVDRIQGGWWCDATGRFLAVSRLDETVDVLELAGGAPTLAARVHVGRAGVDVSSLRAVALTAEGRRLAVRDRHGVTVGPWDDWGRARGFELPGDDPGVMEFTADGRQVVVCLPEAVHRVDVVRGDVRTTAVAPVRSLARSVAIDRVSGRVALIPEGDRAVYVADAGPPRREPAPPATRGRSRPPRARATAARW